MKKHAFEPALIGGIDLKNRFVRSATFECLADKGMVSDPYLAMHEALAKGDVSLIITGYLCFSKTDNPTDTVVHINDDSCLPGLRRLTDMVHQYDCKIIPQLNHTGSQLFVSPRGPVYAPSDVVDPISGIKPTPFSVEQIKDLAEEFGIAAFRAKKAGFDGVQIHGSHGYLVSKFLSPIYNTRTDEYGGSVIKRANVILDILKEVKTKCGSDFPVWIKLNCSDFEHNNQGLTPDDFLEISKVLTSNGMDAIEVSGGTFVGKYQPSRSIKHEAYHLEYATKLSEQTNVSVISVGGFRKLETIEKALATTNISAVSLSRSLIREPALIKRWKEGDRKDAACINCNGCFNPEGSTCFQDLTGERKERQKKVNQFMRSLQSKNG